MVSLILPKLFLRFVETEFQARDVKILRRGILGNAAISEVYKIPVLGMPRLRSEMMALESKSARCDQLQLCHLYLRRRSTSGNEVAIQGCKLSNCST